MGIVLSNVTLEVTRRCNMQCMHCLRGDAQDKDLDLKVVESLLNQVSEIGAITFTGGEPSLVPHILRSIARMIRESNCEVRRFHIVTNGRIVPTEFLVALVELYQVCTDDEMRAGLEVSKDQYHEGYSRDISLYDAFSFYTKDSRKEIRYVINEGNAFMNGLGGRDEEPETWDIDDEYENINIENTVHVAINGNVVSSCDLSYDRIDDEASFNILEKTFETFIQEQLQTEEA